MPKTKQEILDKRNELMDVVAGIRMVRQTIFTKTLSPQTAKTVADAMGDAEEAIKNELYFIELALNLAE